MFYILKITWPHSLWIWIWIMEFYCRFYYYFKAELWMNFNSEMWLDSALTLSFYFILLLNVWMSTYGCYVILVADVIVCWKSLLSLKNRLLLDYDLLILEISLFFLKKYVLTCGYIDLLICLPEFYWYFQYAVFFKVKFINFIYSKIIINLLIKSTLICIL